MASKEDLYGRLTESLTIRSYQPMLAPVVTRSTKEKKKKAKPSTTYADYHTSWSPPNKGKDVNLDKCLKMYISNIELDRVLL